MFERFTDQSRRVLMLAQEEARLRDHHFIGTEHLLLGMIRVGQGIAAQVLLELDVTLEAVRDSVDTAVRLSGGGPSGGGPSGFPPFTPRAKEVLGLALHEARQLGHAYIGTEHLLLGLMEEGKGVGAQVLVGLVGDLAVVRRQVTQVLTERQPEGAAGAVARPLLPRGVNPNARFVLCSFCGRGSPESGLLVSGTNAYICEHCIREWSGRLGQFGSPDGRPLAVPGSRALPRAGQPPEDVDAAESGIRAAFAGISTLSEDGASVPTVEKGETLGPTLIAAMERRRGHAPVDEDAVHSVDEIVFTDPRHAAIWFSIAVYGRTVLSRRRGDAVLVDGIWKVARSTFCDLLAMAGVPCPPVEG